MNKISNIDINVSKFQTKLNDAIEKLSELNGLIKTVPNSNLILNILQISEAKYSSEIEDIHTTFDKIIIEFNSNHIDKNVKEVRNYSLALNNSINILKTNPISISVFKKINSIILEKNTNIRDMKVHIKNLRTGEVIYTPPEKYNNIVELLENLINFIYKKDNIHPLIKLAIIHAQFERIHPFMDGNGRTGRILNILYLMSQNKLHTHCLYLSKYILRNKKEYYASLAKTNNDINNCEGIINFFLKCIKTSCEQTIYIIDELHKVIESSKQLIKNECPKIYSSELVDILFIDFAIKPSYLATKLNISLNTSKKYINKLVDIGILAKVESTRPLYKNTKLDALIDIIDDV
ncbi:adenosine monophosphate-protein transferase [Bacilli bacterium]|nr:adenosine monophosphate-protein transferase [Bacilli bacterium]